MEKLKFYKLPINEEECQELISSFREISQKEEGKELLEEIINEDYIKLLNNWATFLNALSYIIANIGKYETVKRSFQELKEKGFIQ